MNISSGTELTFNSGITGTAAITKSGLGELTFGQAADSSARGAVTTTISDGILRLRNPNNLSAGGLIILNTSANTLALAADADTDFVHPVVANGSGAVIDVDRAPGGSGSNGRHALGEVSTTTGKLTVTGANGYGLTLDKYSMTSSPSLINDAPGALRVGDVEGSPGASARTLTVSGGGDIEITGGISEIAGTGSLWLHQDRHRHFPLRHVRFGFRPHCHRERRYARSQRVVLRRGGRYAGRHRFRSRRATSSPEAEARSTSPTC